MLLWKTFLLKFMIMCGRFSLVSSLSEIEIQLDLKLNIALPLVANYNIAPVQNSIIITNTNPVLLQNFQWGLIPHWAKDGKKSGKLINARKEGIAMKPSYRMPIRKQRCLVLADSFYEWKKSGRQKYPYRIMLTSDKLLVMAGIWEEWHSNGIAQIFFSIITTEANAEMSSIHNRMPVALLTKDQQKKWLADIPLSEVLDLLETPRDSILKRYRISQKLNSIYNNSSDLHTEVNDDLLTLF